MKVQVERQAKLGRNWSDRSLRLWRCTAIHQSQVNVSPILSSFFSSFFKLAGPALPVVLLRLLLGGPTGDGHVVLECDTLEHNFADSSALPEYQLPVFRLGSIRVGQ